MINGLLLGSVKTFLKDIIVKPPVLFPSAALFHVLWLLFTIWTLIQAPSTSTELNLLWMLGYTTFWIAVCDMRKWGAIGYIAVTTIDLVMVFSMKDLYSQVEYGSPISIIDVVFCFFILFYFKRFR